MPMNMNFINTIAQPRWMEARGFWDGEPTIWKEVGSLIMKKESHTSELLI